MSTAPPPPRLGRYLRALTEPARSASGGLVLVWRLIVGTVQGFSEHKVLTLGAALAFFVSLSLAPMLVILLAVAGLLGDDVQARFVEQMTELVGPNAGAALETVIESARR
ncbi:MAG TPA: YhjD/YihY/BrkB family envelope integrity protein, partial [Planctomycetota bacterium]|nr:YhjD/YihY/BrkB family envelope integrity protein [Planctomycetota bacterium]